MKRCIIVCLQMDTWSGVPV